MNDNVDPYWKLRAPRPTPDDDLCSCVRSLPIMLQPHLSSNPVSCIACNLEVRPECVGFSTHLVEQLTSWRSFHDCFYLLWLDSGEFESWAKAELENPGSVVNKRGLALVAELNEVRRAYYWWFQDTGAGDFQPRSRCPACQEELTVQYGREVCERCSIVVAN